MHVMSTACVPFLFRIESCTRLHMHAVGYAALGPHRLYSGILQTRPRGGPPGAQNCRHVETPRRTTVRSSSSTKAPNANRIVTSLGTGHPTRARRNCFTLLLHCPNSQRLTCVKAPGTTPPARRAPWLQPGPRRQRPRPGAGAGSGSDRLRSDGLCNAARALAKKRGRVLPAQARCGCYTPAPCTVHRWRPHGNDTMLGSARARRARADRQGPHARQHARRLKQAPGPRRACSSLLLARIMARNSG